MRARLIHRSLVPIAAIGLLACDSQARPPRRPQTRSYDPIVRLVGDARTRAKFVCPPDSGSSQPWQTVQARVGFTIDLPTDASELQLPVVRGEGNNIIKRQVWTWRGGDARIMYHVYATSTLVAASDTIIIGSGDHDPVLCHEDVMGHRASIRATHFDNWDPFGSGEALSVWIPWRGDSTLHLLGWGKHGDRSAFFHIARSLRAVHP
jgi:hypothetical protein